MRPETKQLLKNISIGFGVFLLIGLILYCVWHGTRLETLTIDEVLVSGGETISHEAVATDVSRLLEGQYAKFIPRRFAWLYPKDEIIDKLLKVERVKDPAIKRSGKKLLITLDEYEPAALWCSSADSEHCVFLDAEGYGFAQTPALVGGAFTRFVVVGQAASTSEVFATDSDFLLLRELESLLVQAGWPVAVIEFDQARDVFVYLAAGGELKVSLLLAPADTMNNLQTVLSTEEYDHIKPGNFEYIDLRFGNKVFVNEFGVPAEEDELEAATSTAIQTAASGDAASN